MNTEQISTKCLNILRHTIGYDDEGNDRWHGAAAEDRRNHFVTGPGSTDYPACVELTKLGLMHDHGPQQIASGNHCFTVTAAGRAVVMALAYAKPTPEEQAAAKVRVSLGRVKRLSELQGGN